MSQFMQEFSLDIAAVRVRFGPGTRHDLRKEIERLGARRALVLSTAGREAAVSRLAGAIGNLAAGVFAKAAMHTPVSVTEEAMRRVAEVRADCLVAVGGGSTTGLAKAIALRTELPQIVVPTTYAGSEATAILGQTENGRKTTLTDPRVRPEVILYDPELVTTLPVGTTVASGLNAMAHAAEALYARDRNPLSTVMAREGLSAFAQALPKVVAEPDSLAARGETLYAAWLCGTVLGQVGMALHHKLCHTLGGSFDLPHAETHAIVLPHAVAYNARAAREELVAIPDIFGGDEPGRSLWDFAARLNAPMALRDIGLDEAALDEASELACRSPYWNPREITRDGIRGLLQNAWNGDPPSS